METPWFTGDVKESLEGAVNIADKYASAGTRTFTNAEEWLDDRFLYHAPVGSFDANLFGLHDVHGNVHEWCQDWTGVYSRDPVREGDGLRLVPEGMSNVKIFRGGSWQDPAKEVRLSRRYTFFTEVSSGVIGTRPMRKIDG